VTMQNEYTCSFCDTPTTILNGSGVFDVYDSKSYSYPSYNYWGPTGYKSA